MTSANALPLLSVADLNIDIHGARGTKRAVCDLSFEVARGQTLCIVGESGCGKSLTALALLNLLPGAAQRRAARLMFAGLDLLTLSGDALARLCGARIAMIFQDPMTSLNPVFPVGTQLIDVLRRHQRVSRREATERAHYLLTRVGIRNAGVRLRQYPFELSGGLRQRVMIAMALMCGPELLIADEPTTALDVTVQAELLALLADIQTEFGLAMVFISHDMGLVSHIADDVLVMYAGRIVERGCVQDVLTRPQHPYTKMLLACMPQPGRTVPRSLLPSIAGTVPPLEERPDDYSFADRCQEDDPDNSLIHTRHVVASSPRSDGDGAAAAAYDVATHVTTRALTLADVSFHYHQPGFFKRQPGPQILHKVNLSVPLGKTVGLVGESGSGKSTIAKLLLGMVAPVSGHALLDGRAVTTMPAAIRARRIQMVFQDPYSSLNPRRTVAEILTAPLAVHRVGQAHTHVHAVRRMLDAVGLTASFAQRYPRELSGGQRQRVAIARALMLQPQWLICDEPTSALDVSVQSQILNLLLSLQRDLGLGILFISHNLAVVQHIANDIVVLQGGRVVEAGTAQEVYFSPSHAYTQELIAATLAVPQAA